MSIPNFRFATDMISKEEEAPSETSIDNFEEGAKGNILDKFENEEDEEDSQSKEPETIESSTSQEVEITEDDKQYYKQLFDYYKNDGFFNEDEEFDGTPEKFEELLNKKKINLINDAEEIILSRIPEQRRKLIEYAMSNPTASDEEILDFFEISNYQPIDTELLGDEKNARDFLKTYLMQERGDDEETANDYLDILEDKNKLVNQAQQIAKQYNIQQEQVAEQKINKARALRKQRDDEYAKFHEQSLDTFNSLSWDKTIKKEIYNTMFSPKLTELSNNIFKSPKAAIQLVNYMRFYDPKTGEINEESFEKASFNPTMKKVKNKIDRAFRSSDAGSGDKKDQNSSKKKSIMYKFAKQ